MTRPLLAVDAPSLLYRAFHALPTEITGPDGRPVNALLGMANQLLQAVERHRPRGVVLCLGADAARYRVDTYPGYHADRPPPPQDLAHQFADAASFFGAFGWPTLDAGPDLEADDLLGSLATAEAAAGGEALLFTGDRDMFQCVGQRVRVLFPGGGGRDGPAEIGPAEVVERYGVDPGQVPDFIALRGDPSDGLPGARGIGEKTARDLLRAHRDLEGVLAAAAALRVPGRAGMALRDQADELRDFRRIATLAPVDVGRPPDAPLDPVGAAAAADARGMRRLAERLRRDFG